MRSDYARDYTVMEIMATAMSREFHDEETAFIGVGPPLIAAMLAKLTHAPNLTITLEGGAIGCSSRRLLLCAGDSTICERAYACGSMWRNFGDQQRGFYDVGAIGGAQIDKYGNINATALGEYKRPSVRIAGSGGANDIGSSARRFVVMMNQEKRRFVEKVDYLTIPGYLNGRDARKKAGLKGGGPSGIISTMGVFRFDRDTGEIYLEKCHPGTSPDAVRENVGWDLKMASSVGTTKPPTREQVEIIRNLDPYGMYLGKGREAMSDTSQGFEFYMKVLDKSYDAIESLFRSKKYSKYYAHE